MVYKDRSDAGRQLAGALTHFRDKPDTIVLGLPRGGVAVACEIADNLHLPLDTLIVRKIPFPANRELAAGAISETGTLILNEGLIAEYGFERESLTRETVRQQEEIARRKVLFRGGERLPSLEGKTVILVDDGIATGATVKAAITTLKQEKLARLVVAVPVAAADTERVIRRMVDEWVCLQTPFGFMAVGSYYQDFTQIEDEEVMAMLKKNRRGGMMHERG